MMLLMEIFTPLIVTNAYYMATHSSILAWEIPWTEVPSGLQSMGVTKSDTTDHSTDTVLNYFLPKRNPLAKTYISIT